MRKEQWNGFRSKLFLFFLFGLAGFADYSNAEGYGHDRDHFDIRLVSPTTPSKGVPGVTQIRLTGSGFRNGNFELNDVAIRLAPKAPASGPSASIRPSSVTRVGLHARRFT